MKSLPSFGPTPPLTNPLSLLPGKYILSDNFILSLVTELAAFAKKENLVTLSWYNSS